MELRKDWTGFGKYITMEAISWEILCPLRSVKPPH